MTLTTYSIVLLLVATAVPACPQIRFEVAWIRPSQPGTAQDARVRISGDRLEVHAYTVSDILDWLNGFQLHRVVGGPDSIEGTATISRQRLTGHCSETGKPGKRR